MAEVSAKRMKSWILPAFAFVIGALIATAICEYRVFKRQSEIVVIHLTTLHGQASFAEQLLEYFETGDPIIARRLNFASSNIIAQFPVAVEGLAEAFPYLGIAERTSSEVERFKDLLAQMKANTATNGPTRGD